MPLNPPTPASVLIERLLAVFADIEQDGYRMTPEQLAEVRAVETESRLQPHPKEQVVAVKRAIRTERLKFTMMVTKDEADERLARAAILAGEGGVREALEQANLLFCQITEAPELPEVRSLADHGLSLTAEALTKQDTARPATAAGQYDAAIPIGGER